MGYSSPLLSSSSPLLTRTYRLLLSYTSRDEVGLYKQGDGALRELQSTISDYTEKSPLYGFLHHRKQKVLVKYVPEGTSRLLQGASGVCDSCVRPCSSS